MVLTPKQQGIAVHALRVAAERFTEDAKVSASIKGHERLSEQFTLQAIDSRELADPSFELS